MGRTPTRKLLLTLVCWYTYGSLNLLISSSISPISIFMYIICTAHIIQLIYLSIDLNEDMVLVCLQCGKCKCVSLSLSLCLCVACIKYEYSITMIGSIGHLNLLMRFRIWRNVEKLKSPWLLSIIASLLCIGINNSSSSVSVRPYSVHVKYVANRPKPFTPKSRSISSKLRLM